MNNAKRSSLMMDNPDNIWKKIVESEGKNKQLVDDLQFALVENIESSKLFSFLKYVKQLIKDDKSIRILDYGCGGGQLLTYLRMLGCENLTGVDVGDAKQINQLNIMYSNMGFESDTFFIYDGSLLPFNNSSFDIIISQQVLEHVHNVEKYFSESKRVLSSKGKILFEFPHRLVPFDTHTRMWFVHYFPSMIRNIFYDKFRENKSQYYGNLLNLQPIWYYKRLLNTMFSSVVDLSEDRISSFVYRDHYEGNINIRLMVDKLVNTPFIGGAFRAILALFSNATLIIKK